MTQPNPILQSNQPGLAIGDWEDLETRPIGNKLATAGEDGYLGDPTGSLPSPSWELPLVPSGVDDTAAIITANAQGRPLGAGTFLFSALIPSYPLGQGPGRTILRATGATARIQGGPALGTLPTGDSGTYGNFTLDGQNIAGATNPLLLVNTSGTTFLPVTVVNSLGDGVIYAGQNCNFLNWNLGGVVGCSLALDNGCGGSNWFGGRLANATRYHLEFRQSVVPPPGAFAVPENNNFYGITFEKGWPGGSPTNLGCVHHLAGVLNRLKYCSFYSGAGATRLLYMDPNTAPGRANDRNELLFLEECLWTGSTGVISAIECSASYAPIVGVSGSGLILEGHNLMSAFTNGILWPGTMPIKDYGQIQCFNVTNPYNSPNVPLRRPRDHSQQQPGSYAPSVPGWVAVAAPVAANSAYFSRFVPSRDITITAVAFVVLTAAGSNDQVDVGLYTEYNHQIVTAGLTAGLLNSPGRKILALATPVTLLAGWIYYVCVATAGIGTPASPAQLAMASFGDANSLFGASPGTAEVLQLAPIAGGGCPAAMASGGGQVMTFPDGGGPAAAVLEAGTLGQ